MVREKGVSVSEDQHELVKNVIENHGLKFGDNTSSLCYETKKKEFASKNDSRGMRWHPLIITWCLSIYHSSPAAYRQLSNKTLGFLNLAHSNTLKKYLSFTSPSVGFNLDIISRMVDDSNTAHLEDYQKNVILNFDEMKIKSDLVYRRSTGQLVFFTEPGYLNDHYKIFERNI